MHLGHYGAPIALHMLAKGCLIPSQQLRITTNGGLFRYDRFNNVASSVQQYMPIYFSRQTAGARTRALMDAMYHTQVNDQVHNNGQ